MKWLKKKKMDIIFRIQANVLLKCKYTLLPKTEEHLIYTEFLYKPNLKHLLGVVKINVWI